MLSSSSGNLMGKDSKKSTRRRRGRQNARKLYSRTRTTTKSTKRETLDTKSEGTVDIGVVMPEEFTDVLSGSVLREKFRTFLKARVAVENLNFYENIEMYEQIVSQELRQSAGEHIREEFLVENAKFWVNLPSDVRESLMETEEFLPESFNKAKLSVVDLMATNFFDQYKVYLRNGEQDEGAPLLPLSSKTIYHKNSFENLSMNFASLLDDEEESRKQRLESASTIKKPGVVKKLSNLGKSSSSLLFSSSKRLFLKKDKKRERWPSHLDIDLWKDIASKEDLKFNVNE